MTWTFSVSVVECVKPFTHNGKGDSLTDSHPNSAAFLKLVSQVSRSPDGDKNLTTAVQYEDVFRQVWVVAWW